MQEQVEIRGRIYRPVIIADSWQKSEFKYYHRHRREWRTVANWNTRERLFSIFSQVKQ